MTARVAVAHDAHANAHPIGAKDRELQAQKNESKILSVGIQAAAVAKRIAALTRDYGSG